MDITALRNRERDLLRSAISNVRRIRIRVSGHQWAQVIPNLLNGGDNTSAQRAGAPAELTTVPG